jgi:hypothetical protein
MSTKLQLDESTHNLKKQNIELKRFTNEYKHYNRQIVHLT